MKKILPLGIIAYEFDELSEEVQEKVIGEFVSMWTEFKEYDEKNKGNFEKAIDMAERMQTPWFANSYVYDYCKDEIINDINLNFYLFSDDGEILPIFYHVNNDGKTNKITYQILKGKEIEVRLKNVR